MIVEKDGAIRPNTSQEILNSLKLVFDKKGTITAGTASPFTDGASATLICNEEYAKKNNLDILAKVVSTSCSRMSSRVNGSRTHWGFKESP